MENTRHSNVLFSGFDGVWNNGQTIYQFPINQIGINIGFTGDGEQDKTGLRRWKTIELEAKASDCESVRIFVTEEKEIHIMDLVDSDPCFGACKFESPTSKFPSSIHVMLPPEEFSEFKETCFGLGKVGNLSSYIHVLKVHNSSGHEFSVVTEFRLNHMVGGDSPT